MDFFQRALIGGALIAAAGPLLGLFLVLRRLSMIGDTLSHVSVAGVAAGYLLGLGSPAAGGMAAALLATLAIERLRKAYRTYAELSIAIMMAGGIALASLLFSLDRGFGVNISSYLFGSIYTLDAEDLTWIAVVTLIVIAAVLVQYKEWFLMAFDEDAAAVGGLPTRTLNLFMSVLTALVISVSIKIVGALLVSALLTIPAACGLLMASSFRQSVLLAVGIAEAAVIAGLLAAGFWNLAPGGTVVLLLIAVLLVQLVIKRRLSL
jgi:ABC-type Mn2+/Zn2+ transport systems, permease components